MYILALRRAVSPAPLFAIAGFLCVPVAAQAQVPVVNPGVTAKQVVKLDELATLKTAKKLLEAANHDYKGHRAKAVHAIHVAIVEIEHQGAKTGRKHLPAAPGAAAAKASIRASGVKAKVSPVHEGQVASDVQLREAHQLLGKVLAELANTGIHPKANAHVQIAIHELEIALKIL